MHTETIEYTHGNVTFKGYAALNSKVTQKRPAIIVAPAWRGQDAFAKNKAQALAELGYIGFAADLYGNGTVASNDEEAGKLMLPLFLDRQLLRGRIVTAYQAISQHPMVDSKRIGAIGFCFGGLTVIELLRSGAPLRGVVSFHGVLGNAMGEAKAKLAQNAKKLLGSILILHGHDDPMVSSQDILSMQKELTDAGVDWQMHIYGHTSHAFTNPEANDPKKGLIYNPKTNQRSWLAMRNFLQEVMV